VLNPKEYELFVGTFYERLLSERDATSATLCHRKKYTGLSGQKYEIDLSYEKLFAGEIRIVVLFECKAYGRRVKINDLVEFAEKIKDIRASKGVFVTTVGYERGAYVVAKANHIGLAVLRNEAWLGSALATDQDEIPPMPFFMTLLMDMSAGDRWQSAVRAQLYQNLSKQNQSRDLVRVGRLASYFEKDSSRSESWFHTLLDLMEFATVRSFIRLLRDRVSLQSQRFLELAEASPRPVLIDDTVVFQPSNLTQMYDNLDVG
jgi:hypothetical protein